MTFFIGIAALIVGIFLGIFIIDLWMHRQK